MGIFSNFRFGAKAEKAEAEEAPVRSRTFSASAFRDAELARDRERREHIDELRSESNSVLTPAIAPVAEVLMQKQQDQQAGRNIGLSSFEHHRDAGDEEEQGTEWSPDEQSGVESAWDEAEAHENHAAAAQTWEPEAPAPVVSEWSDPYAASNAEQPADLGETADHQQAQYNDDPAPLDSDAAPDVPYDAPAVSPAGDNPMAWDEAVGWLSQRSAESRNFVAQYWNWDYDLRVLEFLVTQPDIDAGVAAGVFWLTAAVEDFFPWSDEYPNGSVEMQVVKLTDIIGRRFANQDFMAMNHGFDDSWDCERLKQRLQQLHDDGRIGWSPASIPTVSHAQMLGFDDIPADERQDVIDFLDRHGVR